VSDAPLECIQVTEFYFDAGSMRGQDAPLRCAGSSILTIHWCRYFAGSATRNTICAPYSSLMFPFGATM